MVKISETVNLVYSAVLAVLLLGLPSSLSASDAETPSGGWRMEFSRRTGLTLRYDEIPVIRQNTLYVVSPGWSGTLFNQDQLTPAFKQLQNGTQITVSNDVFVATYTLQTISPDTFRLHFRGELIKDVPAQIEYALGYFNANLLAGRHFKAETTNGPLAGRVPMTPLANTPRHQMAPGFRSLEFESRIGQLKLRVETSERMVFFDARADTQLWAKRAPVFWCGIGSSAQPLRPGLPIEAEMTLTLSPSPLLKSGVEGEHTTRTIPLPKAAVPSPSPALIPEPKNHIRAEGIFRFPKSTQWRMSRHGAGDSRLSKTVVEMLERHGLRHKQRGSVKSAADLFVLQFGRPKRASDSLSHDWKHQEAYRLKIEADGIQIVAPSAEGLFRGLQTLSQSIRTDNKSSFCSSALIDDWPTMNFRGAHFFPSASGMPFHQNLIEHVFSRYKFNHAIIQCEAARWDSHPQIAGTNSIRKADLKRLVDLCRANFVEPIPLINVPGHGEWMFRNRQNLHFAEDPKTPYAYCVHHPDAQQFIRDILEEVIEVFEPKQIHLGHDEVTMRGRFPNPDCPRCRNSTVTELVMTHLEQLSEWLRQRGIQTMIWGDMFLARGEARDATHAPNLEEARARRARIPQDVIITDWHYTTEVDDQSLRLFHKDGLKTIAATWHEPRNVSRFAEAARSSGSLGLLQTTWAGYFPDESALESGFYQFAPFVLAGDYAWSGRTNQPDTLPYSAGEEFANAYFGAKKQTTPGIAIQLDPAAQTSFEALTNHTVLAQWPVGTVRFSGIEFQTPGSQVISIADRLGPPGSWKQVRLKTSFQARELAILNATLWGTPANTAAVQLQVSYEDGMNHTETLLSGRHTAWLHDERSLLRSRIAWKQRSDDLATTLRVTRWANPFPGKKIVSITFSAADPEQAWILVGLTGLE